MLGLATRRMSIHDARATTVVAAGTVAVCFDLVYERGPLPSLDTTNVCPSHRRLHTATRFLIGERRSRQVRPFGWLRYCGRFDRALGSIRPPACAGCGGSMSDPFEVRLDQARAAWEAKDFRLAYRLYLRLALEGSVTAQRHVGMCHDFGQGVPINEGMAVRWYRMAAEQGDAVSQNNLGCSYEWGQGVRPDPAQAARWYRRAAQQGYALAQLNLGELYERGEGVPHDWRRAVHWYRLAMVQGNREAERRLAALLGRMALAA